jgi:hypothetical protein
MKTGRELRYLDDGRIEAVEVEQDNAVLVETLRREMGE